MTFRVSIQEISSEMRQPPLVVKQQSVDHDWSLVSENNSDIKLDQPEKKYVAVPQENFFPTYDFIVSFDHLRSVKK